MGNFHTVTRPAPARGKNYSSKVEDIIEKPNRLEFCPGCYQKVAPQDKERIVEENGQAWHREHKKKK